MARDALASQTGGSQDDSSRERTSPAHGPSLSQGTPAAGVAAHDLQPAQQPLPPRNPEIWFVGASGFNQAVQEAMRYDTPMAVYVYTDWCPYCRTLESEVLDTFPVREYLRGLVKVRINPEEGAAEQGMAKLFGVTGYPRFFVYSPSSGRTEQIYRTVEEGDGWRSTTPEEFIADCRQAAGG